MSTSSNSTTNHVYDEYIANDHRHHHPGAPDDFPAQGGLVSTTSCGSHGGVGECAAAADQHHSLSHAYSTYLAHDAEEQTHWEDVCRSYRQYATFAMAQWANHNYRLHALPEEQRHFLPPALRREEPEFHHRARLYKEAAIRNQFCLDCILRHAGQPNSQDVLHQQQHPQQQAQQRTTGSASATTTAQFQHSSDAQMSKVSSVLKSLARDWSAEGKPERDMAYSPILAQVRRYLPPGSKKRRKKQSDSSEESHTLIASSSEMTTTKEEPFRICVPGAGVGRLACELAALGYAVQGNEFSLYMLLASDFILNGGMAAPEHPLQISPYLLESRNVHAATDPLRPIAIPDVDPFQMILHSVDELQDDLKLQEQQQQQQKYQSYDGQESSSGDFSMTSSSPSSNSMQSQEDEPTPQINSQQQYQADFSMAAGEFVSIYGNPREHERWDAFCCCFFIDTAPSIVEYIVVMHKCLKPGGFVFHFGPLLWHWSGPAMRPDDKTWDSYQSRYSYLDKKYLNSMDLSWQDVRAIFVNVGFVICEEKIGVHALYTADRRSMMNMSYHCVQFVARKKGGTPLPEESVASSSSDLTGRTVQTTGSSTARGMTTLPPTKSASIPSSGGSSIHQDAKVANNNDPRVTPSSSSLSL